MNLWLANPRGFCAGVERAVRMVDALLELESSPVYVRHEIVHNRAVVDGLKSRGAVFVDDAQAIPSNALAVISAHGAAPEVHREVGSAGRRVFDATCPLVTKVHLEVQAHARAGRSVLLVGHRGHVEVQGTLGWYDRADGRGGTITVVEDETEAESVQVPDPSQVAYVTQTTLAVESANRIVSVLRRRFPALVGPHHDDICYATQNRQDAVRALSERCQRVIVIGAPHSSNSVRMVEVAMEHGTPTHLVEGADGILREWLDGVADLGLSSSASAPEHLVAAAVTRLHAWVPGLVVREVGRPEEMTFKLPSALAQMRDQRRKALA
ncbi:MAG: 4-hydroxy-3-methylbut-2-enyl diphosphate reductase [Rhizobacter sp.]|nr:4-hydroxy-3-methylbut-2-enyl diphosphate reductase [Rhizobacter sp.]